MKGHLGVNRAALPENVQADRFASQETFLLE